MAFEENPNPHPGEEPTEKKRRVGRPSDITPEIITKLEGAFAQGCNDQEACFLADISPSVFYNYQKRYPAFRERKDALKTSPVIIARKSVNDAMKDDGWLAMKYLQQKRPEEFGGDNPVPAVTLNISFEKKVSNYLSENADAKQHILTIAKFLKEPDGPQ